MEIAVSAWSSSLAACGDLTNYTAGKKIHDMLCARKVPLTPFLQASLISMYSKSGDIFGAISVFNSSSAEMRDTELYNAMIAAYGHHGMGASSLQLFTQMVTTNYRPDSVTFVSVLNSCSHAGLVDDAERYKIIVFSKSSSLFQSMRSHYNVAPMLEHYTCIVDALGRAGRLEEAERIITSLEQPNIILYKTLLGACRVRNDLERAERIGAHILTADPKDASVYILLANVYAANQQWEKAMNIRELMAVRGVKKIPGISMIELNGVVHKFVVEDRSHPQSEQIYAKLNELYSRMKAAGHKPDTNWVLHNIEEDVKEVHLCYHRFVLKCK